MKSIKTCTLIIAFVSILLNINLPATAKDYLDNVDQFLPTNEQTFELGNGVSLNIEVPGHWETKKDSDGNIIFNNHKAYGDLVIAIMNNVFDYGTDDELKKYVALHKQASLKTIPNNGKPQEGFDKLAGLLIPWILIFEEQDGQTLMHKISYIYNENRVYVVMTTLTPKAPFKDAEKLLNSILISILKEGKGK